MTDQARDSASRPGSPLPQYPQASADYQLQQPAYGVPATAPDGRPLAGRGQRLGARIIDIIILIVAASAVAGVIVGGGVALVAASDGTAITPFVATLAVIAIFLVLQYGYEVEIPLRWNGQTPGKRLLKIAITPLAAGSQLHRGQLAYRYLVMFAFNLLSNCYVGYLDPLWCLWDKPYRQCLHDKPAKTVVVKVEPAHQLAGR